MDSKTAIIVVLIFTLLIGWAGNWGRGQPADPGYDRGDRIEQSAP